MDNFTLLSVFVKEKKCNVIRDSRVLIPTAVVALGVWKTIQLNMICRGQMLLTIYYYGLLI
jgi:hypothetical protein